MCSLILAVSCSKSSTKIETEFTYNVPSEAIAGQPVKFEDLSLGVSSREWTFEDAEPATSKAAVVDVTFNEGGEKAVKLVVNFQDGTKQQKDFKVNVLGSLSAVIEASGLTPKGCAKSGAEITFSLKDVVGEPTSYNWTFQGGTPATSTEASPKVTWNSQIDDVKVTCEMTRAADGAKKTVETSIIAGNYPLLKKDTKFGYDVFGFEGTDVRNAYICYAKDGDQASKATIVDGGSNSSKCMKVDATSYIYMPVGEYAYMNGFIDLFHRNNWCNNASMEVGKKYKMSFDIKASAPALETVELLKGTSIGQMNKGQIGAVMEIAWIYCCTPTEGLQDPLRGLNTAEDWKDYYNENYVSQTSGDRSLHEFRYTELKATQADYSDLHFENLITDKWQTLSDEFTLNVAGFDNGYVFRNCFICVRCSGYGATFYLDNFRIDEIEE